jgi:hypothetical protein
MSRVKGISFSVPGAATRAFAWATAALPILGCDGDGTTSDEVGDVDKIDDGDTAGDDDASTHVENVTLPGIAEWTAVYDVQFITESNRLEIWARNARWEVIGRIAIEDFGSRMVVSSEYADGGFAVEVFADMNEQTYDVLYQTLETEELMARAAALENVLYQGGGLQGKWLACGVFATSVVPACLGPWAALACIPATIVAGCKCTKAALDLPNEEAGLCENV